MSRNRKIKVGMTVHSEACLSAGENRALRLLGEAWNTYLKLPRGETLVGGVDDDTTDFRHAIHNAQRIILSRPALRSLNKPQPTDD